MKKILISLILFTFILPCTQARVRDIFASAPDSIFPLLTQNNRLDCIDFLENGMTAKVKNRFDETSELLKLTDDYLLLDVSSKSHVEILQLNDSIFCLVHTYLGPAPDSEIRFYKTDWTFQNIQAPKPSVLEFWKAVPAEDERTARFAQAFQTQQMLVEITIDASNKELIYTLNTSELFKKEKEVAQQYVQPLRYRWDGQVFQPISKE